MLSLTALTAISIFCVALFFIVYEKVDKAIVAIIGAALMIFGGILSYEEAIASVNMETIMLLTGMMIILEIFVQSQIFAWVNTKIVAVTKANPLKLFVLLMLMTFFFSTILDNVTVVLIVIPVTILLTRGMGLDSKLFVIAETMFSDIGGALTYIGDPANILIGSQAGLSFNDFIVNLWIPIFSIVIIILSLFIILYWKKIRPIDDDMSKLFISYLLIGKIRYQFSRKLLKKSFIIPTLIIFGLMIAAFVLEKPLGLPPIGVIALFSAMLLLVFTYKHINFHSVLYKVEWATLFFFAGLFIMAHGLETTGVLDSLAHTLTAMTSEYSYLLLVIVWATALVSMLINNIPFVTIMIPVVKEIQAALPATMPPEALAFMPDMMLMWWALSLGTVIGGNATPIGSSANVVAVGLAAKGDVRISFFEFFKLAFPMTMISLIIISAYLLFRVYF